MTYRTDPTAHVRSKVAALLATLLPAGTSLLPEFPTMEPKPPCVVMQQIAGSTEESGLGEVGDSGNKSHLVRVLFQFYVHQTTPALRDSWADKVLSLLDNRATLATDKIKINPATQIADISPETGERIHGKVITFPFEVEMTAALS